MIGICILCAAMASYVAGDDERASAESTCLFEWEE